MLSELMTGRGGIDRLLFLLSHYNQFNSFSLSNLVEVAAVFSHRLRLSKEKDKNWISVHITGQLFLPWGHF